MIIIGCGAVGLRVATQATEAPHKISAMVRSSTTASGLAVHGITPVIADLDQAPLPVLPTAAQNVFYFAPPPGQGSHDSRIERFLQACARDGQPARIVLISTTGVYGDCGGAWVDEHRPTNPQTDRARRRLDAEQQLMTWRQQSGGEAVILRVAGIYGPEKLPLTRLRRNQPMVAEVEAPWTNRIHIEDLASVCHAAMRRAPDGAIYNVSDGNPGNMADYFNQVADRAGLPRPPTLSLAEAQTQLSPGLLSYLGESRRLSNRKMLDELQLSLAFPTLAQGLDNCFDDQANHEQHS